MPKRDELEGRLLCQDCCHNNQPSSSGPTETMEMPAESSAPTESAEAEPTESQPSQKRKKGGKPKGATKAKKREDKIHFKEAVNYVCIEFAAAKEEANSQGQKVKDGLLSAFSKSSNP